LQLNNAAAAFANQPHSMPSFADAFRVQQRIESLLSHT
jgi:hypothetical protein